MDVGCGMKGVIAEEFWKEIGIEKGYAVDRHVVKDLPAPWERKVMDIEDVLNELRSMGEQLDFITFCGLLEHIEYEKAFRIVAKMIRVLRPGGGLFCTASSVQRDVDWKCRKDGNPHHKYVSFWPAPLFRKMGFDVFDSMMRSRVTFLEETMCAMTCVPDPESRGDELDSNSQHLIEYIRSAECAGCERLAKKMKPVLWHVGTNGIQDEGFYCAQCAMSQIPHYSGWSISHFAR